MSILSIIILFLLPSMVLYAWLLRPAMTKDLDKDLDTSSL